MAARNGMNYGQSGATPDLPRLDPVDRRILEIVQQDARCSRAEIGLKVGLSAAAAHERIKKLERTGVIRRYAALVDPERAQCDLLAFVEVYIDEPGHEQVFLREVASMGEVQEYHRVTGKATCLLKVRVRDRRALQHLILDRIIAVPGVRGTETIVVLSTAKETPRIHLDDALEAAAGETDRGVD